MTNRESTDQVPDETRDVGAVAVLIVSLEVGHEEVKGSLGVAPGDTEQLGLKTKKNKTNKTNKKRTNK